MGPSAPTSKIGRTNDAGVACEQGHARAPSGRQSSAPILGLFSWLLAAWKQASFSPLLLTTLETLSRIPFETLQPFPHRDFEINNFCCHICLCFALFCWRFVSPRFGAPRPPLWTHREKIQSVPQADQGTDSHRPGTSHPSAAAGVLLQLRFHSLDHQAIFEDTSNHAATAATLTRTVLRPTIVSFDLH